MPERSLLRDDVLEHTRLVVAGGAGPIAQACAALGAHVAALDADLADEEATGAAAATLGAVTILAVDAGALMRAGGDGLDALAACVDGAWSALRAVANAAFIPDGYGKAVLLAPRPGDGEHASAARAALDNLARTTSIEWARHGVRVVAVLPGDATPDGAIAELVAFLASPAGDYYSGCSIELGAVGSS